MGVEGEKSDGDGESEDAKDGRGVQPSALAKASRGKWANQTRTQPVNATGPLYCPSEPLRPLRSLANHSAHRPNFVMKI